MTAFTQKSISALRKDLEKALADVTAKHGVTFEIGGIKFTHTVADIKMSAVASSTDGTTQRKCEVDYLTYYVKYGLNKDSLHRTFTVKGQHFKLTGIKPRNRKYPLLAENRQGEVYKLPLYALPSDFFAEHREWI